MAFRGEEIFQNITGIAGGTIGQYLFAKLNTSGQVVLAGAKEDVIGITREAVTSGKSVALAITGIAFVYYGGSVTAGDKIQSDSAGKAVTATDSQNIVGYALESGSASELHAILLISRNTANGYTFIDIPVTLSAADNVEIMTDYIPGFAGSIEKISFITTTATTDTTGHTAVFTVEIETTATTGGVLTIDDDTASLDPDTVGKVIEGTAITAANTFTATQKISIIAADVTPFSDGAGIVRLVIKF